MRRSYLLVTAFAIGNEKKNEEKKCLEHKGSSGTDYRGGGKGGGLAPLPFYGGSGAAPPAAANT